MEVLGKHLYSTPVVVVRELVQNAHDSCVRRRVRGDDFSPRITIDADPATRTLVIEDNGIGLTDDEIRTWLATVGRGATGAMRREQPEVDGLIGQFGVGFLTAYFVSDRVEVETTSASAPDRGWRFSSRGGQRYALSPAPARPVGSRVTLHLADHASEVAERVADGALLKDYFAMLPTPVFHGARSEAVNTPAPPWRLDPPPSPVRREKLEREYAARFEPVYSPLVCFPLELDEADGTRGLLWIQDGASYMSSDQRNVSVFVRGMLVTHDAKELLPPWAGFVGAVLESTHLAPTASREDLQRDRTYQALAKRLEAALTQALLGLSRRSPEAWRAMLRRHGESLRGAALVDDDLFDCLAPHLQLPTTEGELTLPTILHRSPERRLHLALEEDGPEALLFRALGVPVARGDRYAVGGLSERWCGKNGATLVRLGTRDGDKLAFPSAELDRSTHESLGRLFEGVEAELVPTRFEPASLPFVLVPDREAELEARIASDEADRRIASAALALARMHVNEKPSRPPARLFVNLDNPAVTGALALAAGPRRDAVAALFGGFAGILGRTAGAEGLAPAFARWSEGLTALMDLTETP